MKKIKIILLGVMLILLTFSGCKAQIPEFKKENGNLQVYRMTFDSFGNVRFDEVGYANKNVFSLSDRYLNGSSTKKQSSYVYKSTMNFEKDTEGALGVIVYRGLCYAVFQKNNEYYLKDFSNFSATYRKEYTFDEFVEKARKFNNTYKDTMSGGNGLLE